MQMPQRQYLFALHCALTISIFVLHVQAQTGNFVNIDCGLPENSNYADPKTDLLYESDASYIDSGVSKAISATYNSSSVDQQLWNVRSFPEGTRNCYTLRSPVGKNTTLIRTRFLYGNYDGMNKLPEFDLYLGISFWDTVKVEDASKVINKEIIHVIKSEHIYLCLVKTNNVGVPFISAIELRKLRSDTYPTNPSTSLMTYFRYDLGSSSDEEVVRYGYDRYDRFWEPRNDSPLWTTSNTNLPIDSDDPDGNNGYFPGSTIMETAIVPKDPSQPLNIISWASDDPARNFYIYLHFAETQYLHQNQSRQFNITLNEEMYFEYKSPAYLYTNTIYSRRPRSGARFTFTLVKTDNSTLPPLINAMEAYTTRDIIESQTVQGDVDALLNIKSTYGVKKIWQGDPCAPETSVWDGVQCSSDMDASSIISLNLSSSGLTGNISSYVSNLKSIQNLDLSRNKLTGEVPSFLTELGDLKDINLADNNLTGTIPQELLQKNRSGIIILRLEGNPNLCLWDSCQSNNNTSKNSNKYKATLIAVGVAFGVAFITATAAGAFLFLYVSKRKKSRGIVDQVERGNLTKNHKQFTYSEVLRITSNFQIIIGKGGFGMVYLGYLDNTPVAVKMLSPSSIQGYRQFHVEAELLMRVHHKNLTSLIGYCDENGNMGLIYEYMANGDLENHLSERSPNILSWEKRIEIASDAAQGLDYLHKDCRPPIIHRDVKTTNILLNENFQAKVGDFGLSKVFPIDSETHVTTTVVGTPGYLDPEYYKTNRLNEKSDVYSFGVVLLQIVSGRPAIEKSPMKTHIASWVKSMISIGDITKIIDPRLSGRFDVNSAWKILELAMDCLLDESTKRPTMNQVVFELQHCLALARMQNSEASNAEKGSMIFNSEPSVR